MAAAIFFMRRRLLRRYYFRCRFAYADDTFHVYAYAII